MNLRVIGKLGTYHPSDDRAFQIPQGAHAADAENDDPVAVIAAFTLRPRRRSPKSIYPKLTNSIAISAQTYRQAVRAFADAGCRYLQLDEVNHRLCCAIRSRAAD